MNKTPKTVTGVIELHGNRREATGWRLVSLTTCEDLPAEAILRLVNANGEGDLFRDMETWPLHQPLAVKIKIEYEPGDYSVGLWPCWEVVDITRETEPEPESTLAHDAAVLFAAPADEAYTCPNCGTVVSDDQESETLINRTEPTPVAAVQMLSGGNPVEWEETHLCPNCARSFSFANCNY